MDLKTNEFWVRKLNRALEYRDTDKDGFITRSDFDIIIERYKEMGSSQAHLDKIREVFQKGYEAWGLSDEKPQLTFEEFREIYSTLLEKGTGASLYSEMFSNMFEQVDMNANGEISLKEWESHNKAFGISAVDAKASFEAMDQNHDGIISRQEFIDYHREYFFTAEDKLNSSILFGPWD